MTFKEILAETISARILERETTISAKDYTQGFCNAYRAWADSNARDNPEATWQNYDTHKIILDNFGHTTTPENAQDFFNAARDNGIKTIILTDNSTALMQTIHALCNAGAELAGLTTETIRSFYGEERKTIQAIKLTIPTETQTAEKPDSKTRRNKKQD